MRTIAHIGIPTDRVPEKGTYLAGAKLYVSDPADTKNNLEFLYFEEGCPMPEVIQKRTHIAYFVDDLDGELKAAKRCLCRRSSRSRTSRRHSSKKTESA